MNKEIEKVIERIVESEELSYDVAKHTLMGRSMDLRQNKIIEAILQIHDILSCLEDLDHTYRRQTIKELGETVEVIKEPFKYIKIGD